MRLLAPWRAWRSVSQPEECSCRIRVTIGAWVLPFTLCRSAVLAIFLPSRLPDYATMPTPRDRTRRVLEVRADVFPHLVMPVGPFVAAFRAPVVEMMSDPAAREHGGHLVG